MKKRKAKKKWKPASSQSVAKYETYAFVIICEAFNETSRFNFANCVLRLASRMHYGLATGETMNLDEIGEKDGKGEEKRQRQGNWERTKKKRKVVKWKGKRIEAGFAGVAESAPTR